ncbi:MAG TPA: hypothetical protein EYP22_04100, partial [Methanosarcinales archaeon]|nr:hypothetical protein [Methanosarcinales archaeon]
FPILYFTQLMGIAFGLDRKELGLDKNIVPFKFYRYYERHERHEILEYHTYHTMAKIRNLKSEIRNRMISYTKKESL